MLTLLRVRRAARLRRRPAARRRFPPAPQSGLLAAFIFTRARLASWATSPTPAAFDSSVPRDVVRERGHRRSINPRCLSDLQTSNLGVGGSNPSERAS